jgi:hypothetical protein
MKEQTMRKLELTDQNDARDQNDTLDQNDAPDQERPTPPTSAEPVSRRSQDTRRRRARLASVAGAVLANLAVWALAALAFGLDLHTPAVPDRTSEPVGPAMVVTATLAASLAGWGLLAVLERFTSRARTVWTAIALVVLVASLGAPLTGAGITVANRITLALMHVVTAAVIVPGMRRGSPSR